MNRVRFNTFFQFATGKPAPYDYQCCLACGERNDRPEAEWLAGGTECKSRLINIPTGLGKTAAVVLAWLWNRIQTGNPKPETRNHVWPCRLVYCLPMRTLMEQTRDNVTIWVEKLVKAFPANEDLKWLAVHSPVILMGGDELDEARRDWDIYPEKPCILIGTQDMLLSRALNRGYAAGRARWPKDFALLNNDCLWIFDEVQLMGSGFATSLHLQAWRNQLSLRPDSESFLALTPREKPPVALSTCSWWMSATLISDWLERAVDFRSEVGRLWKSCESETEKLWQQDAASGTELDLLLRQTKKELAKDSVANLKASRDDKPQDVDRYIANVAKKVVEELAKPSSRPCLVILNTVDRAVRLHRKLTGGDNPEVASTQTLLLHSRFRAKERGAWLDQLKRQTARPRLIVATQVVEAGLDTSSDTLFTESCPWPSFIQRLGRAARGLDRNADGTARPQAARIFWMDVTDVPSPYEQNEIQHFAEEINQLGDSANLAALKHQADRLKKEAARRRRLFPYDPRFVPRAKDLFELFDTTPDLTGADVDIARFIRDSDELDVQVFWRDCDTLKREDPPNSWQPEHAELCPVPVGGETGFRQFLQKKPRGRVWRWDYRDGWTLLTGADGDRVYPGQLFLLEATCGGYRTDIGWTGDEDDCPWRQRRDLLGPWKAREASESPSREEPDNTDESDGLSETGKAGQWRDMLTHTREVGAELEALLHDAVLVASVGDTTARILRLAARFHDWGKAHPAFQAKLKADMLNAPAKQLADGLAAKAPDACWRRERLKPQRPDTPESERDRRRPRFRHELASALAILELLRFAKPDHAALAWPEDADLRKEFNFSGLGAPKPVPAEVKALVTEVADLKPEHFDLLLYLVAAHHGKVRMSLRSAPDDTREDLPDPCPADKRQARGVRDGDALSPVTLPGSNSTTCATICMPAITLDLSPMELGLSARYGHSWRERTQALLETHGPFRLAWYETLVRIADARASALAPSGDSAYSLKRELARHHRPMAETPAAGQSPPALGNGSRTGGAEHGLRGRAGEPADPPRDTRPERATRFIETTRGILSYSQLAPLLAEQVVAVQADIERGVYSQRPFEESLLLEFHRRIAGDLVPEWAGRWRAIEVRVGNLQPPPPHAVPLRMRDYCLDLQARWPEAVASISDLTLEFVAFAEGRFLTVHPFQDFNGRVIRLFLSELLRRLDLPPVRLEAEGESARDAYFAALEAADQNDLSPLIEIWKQRLVAPEPPTA